jgi:hypothetical protein
MPPRRFARMWEFDRNGYPGEGTPEHQAGVREVFNQDRWFKWDGPLDRCLFAVDRHINENGRKFLPISFWYDDRQSLYGRATAAIIQLWPGPPDTIHTQRAWDYVVLHEFGHVVGWNLFNPVDTSEQWATDFQWWAMNGQPEHYHVWQRLLATGEMTPVGA